MEGGGGFNIYNFFVVSKMEFNLCIRIIHFSFKKFFKNNRKTKNLLLDRNHFSFVKFEIRHQYVVKSGKTKLCVKPVYPFLTSRENVRGVKIKGTLKFFKKNRLH